jgi:hypothetical protein|tara:strand:- start:1888 stop:2343 length:456 start_codon:yes stop_codon:yes gene_type:complete
MGTRFDNRAIKKIIKATSIQDPSNSGILPGPIESFDPDNDGKLYVEKEFFDPSEPDNPVDVSDERVELVSHYDTPFFPEITLEDRYSLVNEQHTWNVGDRYWKLASKFYGSSDLWWVIAWYNQKPTDAHVKIGDTIAIPMPIDRVLGLFYG